MKIETHVHTKYSHDSILSFGLLYLKLKLKKIECVAITEHNDIIGGIKFREFCNRFKLRINVIIGEEIMTDSGEVIGLFLNERIPPKLSPRETMLNIKKQNGIVYIPHPYDKKRQKTVINQCSIEKNVDLIDCIECHNGRNIDLEYSQKQFEIASKYGLPMVIGSDAHTFIEVGRNYMEFINLPTSADEFRKELKTAHFYMKPCIKASHRITKIVKIYKLISGGNLDELCRIINQKFK